MGYYNNPALQLSQSSDISWFEFGNKGNYGGNKKPRPNRNRVVDQDSTNRVGYLLVDFCLEDDCTRVSSKVDRFLMCCIIIHVPKIVKRSLSSMLFK